MKKQVFLFDFDGLIVNSEKSYYDGWFNALEKLGYKADESLIKGFNGQSSSTTKQQFIDYFQDPDLYDKVYQLREEYIYECIDNGTLNLRPQAKETLEKIKNAGKISILVTGSPRKRVEYILNKLDIRQYFKKILCNDDVKKSKPDPEGYLQGLSLTGYRKEEAVVVEDSNVGVQAGKNSGILTVQIPYLDKPAHSADVEFESLSGLDRFI